MPDTDASAITPDRPTRSTDEPSDVVLSGLLESLSADRLQDVLADVAALATASIPDADGASVASVRNGRAETFAATDGTVRAVDNAQYSVEQGPCVEAGRDGAVHLSQHLPDDSRWPVLADAAAEHGLGSVLSVPIPNGTEAPVGTLNLYARRPDAFCDQDTRDAVGFAKYAGYAIASARERDEARTLASQLAEAMQSRGVIDQAIGVLMAREGCDAAEAMETLRRTSQQANRKVREIAELLVASADRRNAAQP
ncbi:MAG: ANTAR domain-containing protein [Actinomycetes bacterium]